MKLGDKIQHAPSIMEYLAPEERDSEYLAPEERESIYGEVVYIHPQRRYVTLEYSWRRGRTFRESFKLVPKESNA